MLRLGLATAGRPLSLLCIGAHSDDIEIGCGGTILRLLEEYPGSRVHWLVLAAPGVREQEAQNSAEAFLSGAGSSKIQIAQHRESYFPTQLAAIKDSFEQLKPQIQPDMIFTHRLRDRHQDHRVVAELTWNTFRDHLIAQFEIPKYEGDLGSPNCFVPLPRQISERKVQLLTQHFASQRARLWFRPETFHGLMSVRGVECNAPEGQAEAFHLDKLTI
jgi:LmbE family N-acetylglucosaminyl deacetylase